ncbi:hypothetical protein [Paraoerskovia sediminicola]|uniref:hypothetical protein n=1 Tax=Paraoerskovia sediminicola TaxID=1138587 RepID=UPI0025744CBF|nr:hypothetical protein [Paraoerskovia sediminicola]
MDDPARSGARRITDSFRRLENLGLIEVTASRGEPSLITLLCEDASRAPYTPPSAPPQKVQNRYLQIPDIIWRGYIQRMTAPGLAMLLIVLAEPESRAAGMWWSIENFPTWYKISPSMRAKGTKELQQLELLRVKKQMLDTPRGGNGDARDRVRNLYFFTDPTPPADTEDNGTETTRHIGAKAKVKVKGSQKIS